MTSGLRDIALVAFWFVAAWWGLWAIVALIARVRLLFAFMLLLGVVWGLLAFSVAGSALSFLLIILPILVLPRMPRIIPEYQRGVLFRFGRLSGVLRPGLNVIFPFGIDKLWMVDLRTFTIDVPKQEIITRDNVPVIVDAVVYFNVYEPTLAVTKVANYVQSTTLLGQAILRSVLGQHELDDMLAKREQLNEELRSLLDQATHPWGVKVSAVEMKAVELPESMKRAMAKQAEAERERRAKVISADGEFEAAEKLGQAAIVIASEPTALQLRYLQTLTEIAIEKNSTILFPLPIEILRCFGARPETPTCDQRGHGGAS
ncbi:MAG: slipin family protein [Betaproteobacteria bacterium]